jgi:hypothetical protein
MAFLVPDIICISIHGLRRKDDDIVSVDTLGPFLNLPFPLITAGVVRTHNETLFLDFATN